MSGGYGGIAAEAVAAVQGAAAAGGMEGYTAALRALLSASVASSSASSSSPAADELAGALHVAAALPAAAWMSHFFGSDADVGAPALHTGAPEAVTALVDELLRASGAGEHSR